MLWLKKLLHVVGIARCGMVMDHEWQKVDRESFNFDYYRCSTCDKEDHVEIGFAPNDRD